MNCKASVACTASSPAFRCRATRLLSWASRRAQCENSATRPSSVTALRREDATNVVCGSLLYCRRGDERSWRWRDLSLRESTRLAASSSANPANASSEDDTPESDGKRKLGSNVPWGSGKIFEIMVLWLFAFCVFRAGIWRVGMFLLGISSETDLTPAGQAAFTLGLDMSMLGATILILKKSLQGFRPLRERGLFPLRFKGKWWIFVLVSCLWIPLVDWLGAKMMIWFPDPTDGLPSNMEVQLARGCTIPNVLYFILLSICAPVWEETMFRGFLLPSLGKFLPTNLAIISSSSVFAIMHGSLRQFLPLFVLGVVIARAFVASNNLLPAIVLHSLYNCYVFLHVLMSS
ncbi:hypothetical protein BSKO_12924 [Bryopsis sp. KO-2023]|nr:hypothetical protein BSKO_12924 [Bryopsis sp. KO-2023]